MNKHNRTISLATFGSYVSKISLVFLILILAQCQLSVDEEIQPDLTYYTHDSDYIAIEVAKNLASSLESREVRSFVKSKVLKEFDGDFNFLVGQELNTRVGNSSFEEVVFGNSSVISRAHLYNEYPLLQIALPELATKSPADWDIDNHIPLVAVRSILQDKDQNTVLAFDSKGGMHYLDINNEPENLVFVIGSNERLVPMDRNRNARTICEEPIYADPNFDYYSKDQLDNGCEDIVPPPPPTGGGDPDPSCTCDRDCKDEVEKLFKLKFLDIDKLRKLENWLWGKVELRVIMVYMTKTGSGNTSRFLSGKRIEFRSCNIWGNNCSTFWKTYNSLYTKFEPEYGDRIKVVMFEEDHDILGNYSSTSYISLTSRIDGDLYIKSIPVEVYGSYTKLSDVEIQYCDVADAPGKWYSNDHIEFFWGHN